MHPNKFLFCCCFLFILFFNGLSAQPLTATPAEFPVRGFHLDLRIQVMKMPAVKKLVTKLKEAGMNTLIMEYEATYPFETHPLIANRYAYTKEEIKDLVSFCGQQGVDVIPLQQSFGHVEYVLRNSRYASQREDNKDFAQVCPSKEAENIALFTDLFTEMAATHPSKYIHIGADETRLLGHCAVCKARVEKEGVSKLYGEHIKLMCDIVIKLGKIPLMWADIALKYPDALQYLPKQVVFVDWNYGWKLDRFGDHEKLMKSGFEIWGAASLRSSPDNYNLTTWQKHFENIRDFLPAARKLGYKGMIMTSWSTSGIYSPVFESAYDLVDLYAVRRVYPITAFNMLTDAFLESMHTTKALDIDNFVVNYGVRTYGFDKTNALAFWKALKTAPYEVGTGKVIGPLSLQQLADSASASAATLRSLMPKKNKAEYEHYILMADTRMQYLNFQLLEKEINGKDFRPSQIPPVTRKLAAIIGSTKAINHRFIELNKDVFYPSELELDNESRLLKVQLLYDRLAKTR